MRASRNRRSVWILAALALLAGSAFTCSRVVFLAPLAGQLSATGPVDVLVDLPPLAQVGTLEVLLDDGQAQTDVTSQVAVAAGQVTGSVAVTAPGAYTLRVRVQTPIGLVENTRDFETVELANADVCEVLNSAECLLPYPSDRFLVDDPTRSPLSNQKKLVLPAVGLPAVNGDPLDPTPFEAVDGFSPTAPVLMHIPGDPDLALSGADVLVSPDLGNPQSKPYVGIRTQAGTSIDPDSPTVIMNADTGERILHFAELDARASDPARRTLILRPAEALTPGQRYIVAVRGLVDGDGELLEPEAPFRVLRDLRPTTIPAIESRRDHFENDIFAVLEDAPDPVARGDLQLAFDYTVQSDHGLTSQVISMRDQAYAWLEDQVDVQANQTFTVTPFGPADTDSKEFDCSTPGTTTWRIVRGTYQVPLFLTENPDTVNTLGVLNVDSNGVPVQNGVTHPVFTLSIPCSAKTAGAAAPHAILLGHGLFGTGDGLVVQFGDLGLDYVSGATNFRGLSSPDLSWVATKIIAFGGESQLNNFPALPDRLKQGMINTLLLAHMMKRGDFNVDPAFELASGVGALTPAAEEYYFGASLGGIMGTYFASLTTDVERFNVDVPAVNFSLLLQRSTQFTVFETLLTSIGLTDPMEVLLGLSLQHELWVRAEPAGYLQLLRPQVQSGAKKLLVTMAWLDKQVSNQATEIMVRSLGVPNLDASVLQQVVGIPDVSGPVDSAWVIYDTGSFDIYDPAQQPPIIPALANQIPSNVCDPHPVRFTIPDSIDQVTAFLQPGGQISNFCNGICDGADPSEQPGGGPPCDPLAP